MQTLYQLSFIFQANFKTRSVVYILHGPRKSVRYLTNQSVINSRVKEQTRLKNDQVLLVVLYKNKLSVNKEECIDNRKSVITIT